MIDAALLQYAQTPAQRTAIQAILEHGSGRAAARALSVHHSTIEKALARVKAQASQKGFSPEHDMTKTVPDPFYVKRVSQYYVEDALKAQWVISEPDKERRLQLILDLVTARCEELTPRAPVQLTTNRTPDRELCNLITMTDCHVGMLAWGRETGADWDLKIAREQLTSTFVDLIQAMPAAGTCIVSQLGDFLHTDGLKALTPGHGHCLDADGRYQKISEVAVDILEDVIAAALARNDRVHVIMAEGNHDESGSGWLRILFKRLFRDNPRVTIDDSPLPYYAYQHGRVMLAFHHGHKLKPAALPMWFATQFSEMWGQTTQRYGHSGHQHHLDEKDHMGMRWLQHPTLAAPDAHTARGGWISPREAIGITYDLEGEANRIFARPKMFRVH